MKVVPPSLAPILRSATQGRILASVLDDPTREQSLTDLAHAAATSFPTAKREIERAQHAGLVTIREVGRARLVRANENHPLYGAVRRVVLGTFGVPAIITREFAALDGVAAVALFGSWAARYLDQPGPSPADVDVFVIGDPDRDALDEAAERAERLIGLPVQVTVRSVEEWERGDEAFLQEVKRRPIVALILDDEFPVARELRRLEEQVEVERLIREGGLERVEPSGDTAARLIAEAEAHLRLSARGVDDDPAGALQLAYDAARKGCAALLAVQGLRATTQSGHRALLDAVQFQFNDRGRMAVFGRLNRLRRTRHASEYPTADSPSVTTKDAEQALRVGRDAVGAARSLLASARLDRFA